MNEDSKTDMGIHMREKIMQILKERDKDFCGFLTIAFKKPNEADAVMYGDIPGNISDILRHFAKTFEDKDWRLIRREK